MLKLQKLTGCNKPFSVSNQNWEIIVMNDQNDRILDALHEDFSTINSAIFLGIEKSLIVKRLRDTAAILN